MSWDYNEEEFKASLSTIPQEAFEAVEEEAPSQRIFKPGEYLVFMHGFVEKPKKDGTGTYTVVLFSMNPNTTDEKAMSNVFFSLYDKEGTVLQTYKIQTHIRKFTGELFPAQTLKSIPRNAVGALIDGFSRGPAKVKASFKLPYFSQVSKGAVQLMDPATGAPLEKYKDLVFEDFEQAKSWTTKSTYEGGPDIKISAGFPDFEIIGPADGWELTGKALDIYNSIVNRPPEVAEPAPVKVTEPPKQQPAPTIKQPPWVGRK